MSIKTFFAEHFEFSMHISTWISFVIALLIIPCTIFLPASYGYENGLLENFQIIVLFLCFLFAIKANKNKRFFNFVALVVIILFLREINCGRTLFFAIPGEVNAFYGWKDIKYGYLAHPIYGLYIAYTVFYFLKNKLFFDLKHFLQNFKLPFGEVLFLFLGILVGEYAEKCSHNFIFEEMGELLFYVSLCGIIYLYAFEKIKKRKFL